MHLWYIFVLLFDGNISIKKHFLEKIYPRHDEKSPRKKYNTPLNRVGKKVYPPWIHHPPAT